MSVISQKQVDPLQHHTTQIKDELQTTQQEDHGRHSGTRQTGPITY